MKQCPNCNASFDGKFCPDCGTKVEEVKVCPNCGTERMGTSRFCNECGYAYDTSHASERKNHTADATVSALKYHILKSIPMILFALFSISLFFLYNTPIAKIVLDMDDIPDQSLCTVYTMNSGLLSEIPELSKAYGFLIALLVVSAVVALGFLIVTLVPSCRYKKLGKLYFPAYTQILGFIIYLAYAIVGIVIISKIKSADDGLGLFAAGLFPILAIVFSILFAILSIIMLSSCKAMETRTPELSTQQCAERYFIAEQERRRIFYATHEPPQKPHKSEVRDCGGNYRQQLYIYKHAKRKYDHAKEGAPSKMIIWLDMHKGGLIAFFSTMACIVIFSIVFFSPFRTFHVKRIQFGDEQAQVLKVLGEPHQKNDANTKWFYYNKKYRDILKEIEKNEELQAEALENEDTKTFVKLTSQHLTLVNQLENTVGNYIEVRFDGEKKTIAVLFDRKHCNSTAKILKEVQKVKLSNDEFSLFLPNSNYNLTGQIFYTDRSYQLMCLPATAYAKLDPTIIGMQTLSWKDSWGEISCSIKNATAIQAEEFKGRDDLKNVIVWNGVKSIEDGAFHFCSNLTSITIPESVTSIGDDVFSWCSGLTSIEIPDSVTSIGDDAFYYCTGLTSIEIPSSVTSIGEDAFSTCTGLTSITIPESVTSIGAGAFSYCNGLTSITIPNSITSIGEEAFCNCSSLTSIEIPSSVTSIGDYAFSGCSGLTSITIPDGVTSIGVRAFYNCSGLTSITIPYSVTSIGERAFLSCSHLTSIEIPSSVTSIGEDAFCYCGNLTIIIFIGTTVEWNAITKGSGWNDQTGTYIVHCTDGDLAK